MAHIVTTPNFKLLTIYLVKLLFCLILAVSVGSDLARYQTCTFPNNLLILFRLTSQFVLRVISKSGQVLEFYCLEYRETNNTA